MFWCEESTADMRSAVRGGWTQNPFFFRTGPESQETSCEPTRTVTWGDNWVSPGELIFTLVLVNLDVWKGRTYQLMGHTLSQELLHLLSHLVLTTPHSERFCAPPGGYERRRRCLDHVSPWECLRDLVLLLPMCAVLGASFKPVILLSLSPILYW